MRFLYWLSATDTGKKFNDILNNGYKEEGAYDTFGEVREAVTTISRSTIQLIISFSLAMISIAILIVAVKIGSGNPAARNEAKTRMLYVLFSAAGLFLLSAIILFVAHLAGATISD